MFDKLWAILGSERFYANAGIGLMVWLQTNDWRQGLMWFLGLVVGVYTIDRFGEKFGGN